MSRKVIAIYSIGMGLCMISMWSMFLLTGGIPELNTEPYSIAMPLLR